MAGSKGWVKRRGSLSVKVVAPATRVMVLAPISKLSRTPPPSLTSPWSVGVPVEARRSGYAEVKVRVLLGLS